MKKMMTRHSQSNRNTIQRIRTTGRRKPIFGVILAAILGTGPIYAEPPVQISAPRVATMLESDGTLRALHGFGGLWAPGEALETGVADFACGNGGCALNLGGELVLDSVRWPAPEDDVIVAVSPEGDPVAYLTKANRVARLFPGRNEISLSAGIAGLSAADRVLSIGSGADDDGLIAAVANEASVRIVNQQGAVLNWLPDGTSSVLLLGDGAVVYACSGELTYQAPGAAPIRMELDQVTHLRTAGDGFVQVTTTDAAYILETSKSHAGRLTRLPTEIHAADSQPPARSRVRARGREERDGKERDGEAAQ